MIQPRHIWNVIYTAQSNRSHPPTSPNTVLCLPRKMICHEKWHLTCYYSVTVTLLFFCCTLLYYCTLLFFCSTFLWLYFSFTLLFSDSSSLLYYSFTLLFLYPTSLWLYYTLTLLFFYSSILWLCDLVHISEVSQLIKLPLTILHNIMLWQIISNIYYHSIVSTKDFSLFSDRVTIPWPRI